MKKLVESRMIILDVEGNIIEYSKFGMLHQDCLDDFVSNNKDKYDSSNRDYLVSQGNCLFYHSVNGMFACFLPEVLSSSQLYKLDYMLNFFDDITYCGVMKGNGSELFEFDVNNLDDIKERFSNEVIQSYYKVRKR